MSLPISLHSNQYLEHLREFREDAFTASHWLGRRRSIGKFTFGRAHASWLTEEGGHAHLLDEGLRHGDTTMTKLLPTTLRLYEFPGGSPATNGIEVTTFKMDIDDIGCIEVYHNVFATSSMWEIAKAELLRRADKKHELSVPTDEQRELLYTEMLRGATGLYGFAHLME